MRHVARRYVVRHHVVNIPQIGRYRKEGSLRQNTQILITNNSIRKRIFPNIQSTKMHSSMILENIFH